MTNTERPKMTIQRYYALLVIATLQLFTGSAQTAPDSSPPSSMAYKLSPGATEVEKLAEAGVGEDVILAYIGQSPAYFNLSAADIAALTSAGVSSQAVTAMLNHDGALHNQQLAENLSASSASSTPVTPTQSTTVATTTTSSPPSSTSIVVTPPPAPAPQVEVIPASPGPDYIWTPGWWSWNGGAWIWFGGYWGYPVRPGHIWLNGRFYHGRGVEVIRGHRR
jgi:hypothetical protein